MTIGKPPEKEAEILKNLEIKSEALRAEGEKIKETVREATDAANVLLAKKEGAEKVAEDLKTDSEKTDEDLLAELEALENEVAEENENITALEIEKGGVSSATSPKTAEPTAPSMPDTFPVFSAPPTFSTPTPDTPPISGAPANPVNMEAKTKGLAEKIKEKVKRAEVGKGEPLTEQEQREIVVNTMTQASNEAGKAKLESSHWAKQALAKTIKGWENLDKTKTGRITKGVASAAFIGGSIFVGSWAFGNIPIESASKKLLWRMGLATGINTLMASKLSKKPFSEQKMKAIKIALMTGGLGVSFLTGGATVVAIGIGGIILKNLTNYVTRKQIERLEKKLKKSPEKIESVHFNDNYTSEKFTTKIDEVMREREKIIKNLKRWKQARGILNGSTSIMAGIFTAEAFDRQIEAGTANDDSWLSKDAENLLEKPKSWIENIWDKRPEWLKSDSGTKDNSTTVEADNTDAKDTDAVVDNTGIENTTKEISITFDKGEGGIQGIVDLKEQIREVYPDLSKASESVQEFVNGNSTKQAIEFGFFDPDDPSGNESAGIWSGSTLRFDGDRIVFYDARTDTDQIKYEGKMFDSGDSAKINQETPEETPTEEEVPKDVTPIEPATEETPIEETLETPKDVTPIEQIIPQDETPIEQEIPKDVTPVEGGGPAQKDFDNLTQEEIHTLYPETTVAGLANQVMQGNASKIFDNDLTPAQWSEIGNSHEDGMNAESLLNATRAEIKVMPEDQQDYVRYLHKLQNITHLEPIGISALTPVAESPIEFETRALEHAIRDDKLDKVRL